MRNTFRILFTVLIISLFIIRPASSYADWHGHNGDTHSHGDDHHDHGFHNHSFVGVNFSVWPNNYYYAPYYSPADDVLVSSPIYEPVVVNGMTYYLNNGTYYIYNGYGYQAVAPPVTIVQPPVVIQPPPVIDNQTPPDTADSFTINIPNARGSYTAVTLKKSGNGFIGPQGEFYPEFPAVSQLKVIYGK